ncbi:MAG: LXG domain-containing protein [Lachnospiraceae bacterium]|nr:LXG domain-containing protein [Lachnospiraceae bacterium]
MKKDIRTEEMEQAERMIQSGIAEWTRQMNHVREAFDRCIVCMETKAEGVTAESISSYIVDIHKYLLNQFFSLFTEMSSRIVQYVEEFPKGYNDTVQLFAVIDEYEAAHLKNDFDMMENMMNELERLIEKCRGKSVVQVGCYQKGSIWKYGEVWELEHLAQEREEYLMTNAEALQRAMEAYRNRLIQV